MQQNQNRRPKSSSATWPGLLLGSLLIVFVGVLLYAAYLFLMVGQATFAGMPDMPALSLPRLVRAAPQQADSPSRGDSNLPGAEPGVAAVQAQPTETPPQASGRVTILILGVDNRPGETSAGRTDSIMVLTADPDKNEAGMVSARDLWVEVPALKREAKINTVYALGELNKYPGGGMNLLKDTISGLIDQPVNYYVSLNFDGFKQVIDLLGGVDIDVPKEINDPRYPDEGDGYAPLYIPAGRVHMDGKLALKYARTRNVDNDYGRARRQQQVMLAVKDKLKQPGQIATLLPRLPALAIASANTVHTDIPIDKAITLARALDKADLSTIDRVVVDSAMGVESTDEKRGFVLTPDLAKVRAAAAALFDRNNPLVADEAARKAAKSEAARVIVLNGSPEEGLAASTGYALRSAGVNVVAIGNADRFDYEETWLVVYGTKTPATLELLARRFQIPLGRIRSEPASSTADIAVVVGADQVAKTAAH